MTPGFIEFKKNRLPCQKIVRLTFPFIPRVQLEMPVSMSVSERANHSNQMVKFIITRKLITRM